MNFVLDSSVTLPWFFKNDLTGYADAVLEQLQSNQVLVPRLWYEEVANILTQEFDVPPENLVTQGYGEEFLKIDTDGPERRNRRVTVRRITPLLDRRVSSRNDD